jgi:serine/threonine protein kinase
VRRQILLELRTLHKSACPEIVPYHGAFYKDGAFYLVLEYMDGGSIGDLLQHVRGKGMPERVIARFATRVCPP